MNDHLSRLKHLLNDAALDDATRAIILDTIADIEREQGSKYSLLLGLTHDLRTQLPQMVGYIDILRSGNAGALNDEQIKFLDTVLRITRLHVLNIESMWDLSSIMLEKLNLRPEPVHVSSFLNGVKHQCDEMNIDLVLHYDDDIGMLGIDRKWAEKALVNLLLLSARSHETRQYIVLEATRNGGNVRYAFSVRPSGETPERIVEIYLGLQQQIPQEDSMSAIRISVAYHLCQTIGSTLRIEKAENGNVDIEVVIESATSRLDAINLCSTLHQVAESLRPQADLKQQTLTIDIGSGDAYCAGNEAHLQQAFENIIHNAIKFTPEDGKIIVRGKVEDGEFRFEVEDNGYGIPKVRQDKIFERFYRVNMPGTEDIPGTGLGLSIVKSVVQQYGGDVWFKSEEGQGSTFGFWLPVQV